ncbi:MAG: hypothetical protein WA982_01915 [Rubrobacteraceae bacterium]
MNDSAKVLLAVVGGLVLLLLLGIFTGGGGMMGAGMMGGFGVGWLFMLLFWGLLIAMVVGLVVFVVNQIQR